MSSKAIATATSVAAGQRPEKRKSGQQNPSWNKGEARKSLAQRKREFYIQRRSSPSKPRPQATPPRQLVLPDIGLTSHQLAALAGVPENRVFKSAKDLDDSVYTPRSILSPALVELVTEELRLNIRFQPQVVPLLSAKERKAAESISTERRMPIITVMGHVDHGKTSLLDALRKSNTAEREVGGITQSIAAFQVPISSSDDNSNQLESFATFIDTPGHAAFKSMRANGAVATDIVVLVVAADDGVMPQTIEAAKLARVANVPIIVAINKCDTPGANPERVRSQLVEKLGVTTEQLGGDVQCVDISAKTGSNLGSLLDAIIFQAELLELRASFGSPGSGICLECRVDRSLGSVATIVVRSGVFRVGDSVVFQSPKILRGDLHGRVRQLISSDGMKLKKVNAGMAVGVTGIKEAMPPGVEVRVVDNDKVAKEKSQEMIAGNAAAASTIELANELVGKREAARAEAKKQESGDLEEEGTKEMQDTKAGTKTLLVIVKGDVKGSAEAVGQCVQSLETSDLHIRMLKVDVGDVNDVDMKLISVTKNVKEVNEEYMVIAFNVRTKDSAKKIAKRYTIPVLTHSLIYHLEDEVRERIGKILKAQEIVQEVVASAKVSLIFENGTIAGCTVDEGCIRIGAQARILRLAGADSDKTGREEIFSGAVESIKRFAKNVESVSKGNECGVRVSGWSKFEGGDVIEIVEEKRGGE